MTETVSNTASQTERPFQFRLVHLLIVTALVGLSIQAVVLMRNAVEGAREAAREMVCKNNLRNIALALQNYHDSWNCFPPSNYADSSHKPVHSWRVLITPFLGNSAFSDQYDFSQPWDGPSNSKLNGPWKTFYCPSDRSRHSGLTNYVGVVGTGTHWLDDAARTRSTRLGSASSIMVVEISAPNIHWMEPRDLELSELDQWIPTTRSPRLSDHHIEGGMVVMADGSVEPLSRDETILRLRKMAAESQRVEPQ